MTTKPKPAFNSFALDEHDVLYGEFVLNEYEYSIRELLDILTTDQLIYLRHRLDRELQIRMGD